MVECTFEKQNKEMEIERQPIMSRELFYVKYELVFYAIISLQAWPLHLIIRRQIAMDVTRQVGNPIDGYRRESLKNIMYYNIYTPISQCLNQKLINYYINESYMVEDKHVL
jgi:hypothetical protein